MKNVLSAMPFDTKTPNICQGRLGTNMLVGKTQNKGGRLLAVEK